MDTQASERKTRVLARLRRAEGQVRAVVEMVQREDDCEKIAQQLSAARKALDRAFYDMLACAAQQEMEKAGTLDPRVLTQLDHVNGLLARYG